MGLSLDANESTGESRLDEGQPLPPTYDLRPSPPSTSFLAGLYNEHSSRLRRYFSRRSSPSNADDLVQETFVRLASATSRRPNSIEQPRAYVNQIANNLLREQARFAARRSAALHVSDVEVSLSGPDPVAQLEARDMLERLEAAMAKMKPATREIFMAHSGDPHVVRAIAAGLLAGGLILVVLVYALWAQQPPLHGAARFASERELRRHGFRSETGIVVGRKRGKFLTFGGPEHVIVEAPTRSGKGVGIVIPNLLTWEGSVVVLDVKRENYGATAGFRAHYGQDVFLFNPTDREGRTARYNPLSYIDRSDPDDVIIELQKIATMLFVAPEHGEAFWATGARTGFTGVGAYLAEATNSPFTLGEIYRRMTQSDVRAIFKRELAKPSLNLSVGCRTALSDFAGGSDNSFADIKKTITNVLGLWLNPLVDWATSVSDFDLRDLRKRRMSIYLGVSPDELDRIAPLYNLLFQQLIDLNVRDLPDETTAVPVLVILDEFARLGRASVIASAFSYVAGYGIRLLPVIQSRSQLRGVYGEHVADEIVANCGVEVAFTPKELRVANELSERLGYVGQASVSKSQQLEGLFGNRSRTTTDQRRALMLPQELMQFPTSKLILLRGGIPPIMGEKIFHFKNRFFKKRAYPPPQVHPIERVVAVAAQRHPIRKRVTPKAKASPAKPQKPKIIDIPGFAVPFHDVSTVRVGDKVTGTIDQGNEHG